MLLTVAVVEVMYVSYIIICLLVDEVCTNMCVWQWLLHAGQEITE